MAFKDKSDGSANSGNGIYGNVYALVPTEQGKDEFVDVGIAFENRDGSLNVLLKAWPCVWRGTFPVTNVKLQIRKVDAR